MQGSPHVSARLHDVYDSITARQEFYCNRDRSQDLHQGTVINAEGLSCYEGWGSGMVIGLGTEADHRELQAHAGCL